MIWKKKRNRITKIPLFEQDKNIVIDDEGNYYESVVPKTSIIPHLETEAMVDENNGFDESDFEEVSITGISNSYNPTVNKIFNQKNKKPVYVCKVCEIYFTKKILLDNHMKFTHREGVGAKKKITSDTWKNNSLGFRFLEQSKQYKCNYCQFKTNNKSTIILHVTIKHPGVKKKAVEVRTPSITFTIESKPIQRNSPVHGIEDMMVYSEKEKEENEEEEDYEEVEEIIEEVEDEDEQRFELLEEDNDKKNIQEVEISPVKIVPRKRRKLNKNLSSRIEEIDPTKEEMIEEKKEDQENEVADVEEANVEKLFDEQQDQIINDDDDDEAIESDREDNQGSKKKFACPYCEFESNIRSAMNTHISRLHEKAWQEMKEQRVLLEAQRGAENIQLSHACLYCDFTSNHRPTLNAHTRRKHPRMIQPPPPRARKPTAPEINCDLCDFRTNDKRKMGLHIERKHTIEPKYGCEYCNKKFKTKVDLSSHIRFQHIRTPAVCDVCGKICANNNSLHVHQKREHYLPEFECHICHRRMVTQANLEDHIIKQHEQRVKYQCEQCGKVFNQPSKLKQHHMTHTGEKPHTCQICKRSFARRAVFRQHLLTHTNHRPYVCDLCGKAFRQKPGLICHRKSHPGEKPPLPVVYIDSYLKNISQPMEEEE